MEILFVYFVYSLYHYYGDKSENHIQKQIDKQIGTAIQAIVPRIGKIKSCTSSDKMDPSIQPIQQKQGLLHGNTKTNSKSTVIEELQKERAVSGPLDNSHSGLATR